MTRDSPSRSPSQADHLGQHLLGLARTLRVFDSSEECCCGVTMTQCHALLAFGVDDGLPMAELAGRLGLSISTATRLADSMAKAGLAERHRPETDRRVVLLRLTPEGRQRAKAIASNRRAQLAALLESLPAARRSELLRSLELLLNGLTRPGSPCCPQC